MNNIIRRCINYLLNTNKYSLLLLIFINLGSYLFRFSLYRSLTEFISNILDLDDNMNWTLMNYFLKLSLLHLINRISYYYLKKSVIGTIRGLFSYITKRIIYYKIDFFKENSVSKIGQIWYYLNSIEHLLEKLIIDIPKIAIYLLYYTYTIYNFSPLAVFLVIPVNIGFIYLLHPFSRQKYKYQEIKTELDLDMKNKFLETITNVEYVKQNCQEDNEISKVIKSYNNYKKVKLIDNKITTFLEIVSEIFNDFLTLLIYSVGVTYIISGKMKPIELLYLAVHTGNFYIQLSQLKDIYDDYRRMTPKLDILNSIISYSKVEDKYKVNKIIENYKHDNDKDIIFSNVSFSYNNNDNIFNNKTFIFRDKQINLLLGPNGSGKSTIIKLLLRMYDLENDNNDNSIYYKGKNINQLQLYKLRKSITFVPQEPVIFNTTVWDNLLYGINGINETEVLEMCDILECKEWVLENKDKTTGFMGKNLSGGEKKRIQLINTICKKSEIIVFDEPSNALDKSGIIWFVKFIKKIKEISNKTIIIITHDTRLNSIAENIIEM
jgi:ABC-type bacteriocin/lantibiotic exporter with double-glycine peptidase domain